MVIGTPSTCMQAIQIMLLNEFSKATTQPTTQLYQLRQSTLVVLLTEEGIKPKEEEAAKAKVCL